MTLLLQELVVGITTGAIYALIALGYTMVYGIIELINFAHGDIFMIGTLISITIFGLLGITNNSQPTGLTLAAVLIITCLGAMLVCASFPQIFPQINYSLGGVSISSVNILVIVVSLILMVGLQWMVTSTRIGRAMRAVAQDREAAALMGVNVDRIIAITFFIGAGLAGAAGFIYGLQYGSTIFIIGFQLGLIAFTAAVLGGIGNLVGAMLGGVLIGIVEALASLIPDTVLPHGGAAWHQAIIFAILILILVFRPSGLLGQRAPEKV